MSNKQLTEENSREQADLIMQVKLFLSMLDVEYLEQAHKDWKADVSFRESAVILASNVDAAMAKNELDRLLLKQLERMIELAKGEKEIAQLKSVQAQEELQRRAVDRMFGI